MKLQGKLVLAVHLSLLFLLINGVDAEAAQLQVDLGCVRRPSGNDAVEKNCFLGTIEAFNGIQYQCVRMFAGNDLPKKDNQTCEHNYDAMYTVDKYLASSLPEGMTVKDITWSCRLRRLENICDGQSDCLTDECGCGEEFMSDLFYCVDGSGCISWDKLCDNFQDCKDGSDECFCAGHLVFYSSEMKQWACFSKKHYCSFPDIIVPKLNSIPNVLRDIDCVKYDAFPTNPIGLCLDDEVMYEHYIEFQDGPIELVQEYCSVNCSHIDGFNDGWKMYCNNIFAGILPGFPFSFVCNTSNFLETYAVEQLCDGKRDCNNGADESGCPFPDRFHCDPNVTAEWVHIDKMCDNVKDCSNGADECGTCQFEALSSSEFLIQSRIILAVTSIMGIVIIVLNLVEGIKCYKTSCTSQIKAIDRIFLLQTFLYDSLMGLYLCSIVLAAIVLKVKGDYCLLEQDWRASPFCSALGVIFSVASHGSLLAIAAVSITRFLTCHSFLTEISKRAAILASIIGACLNIFHSIIPLLPIKALSDTFRTAIFFKNLNENPFFDSNPVNISRLIEIYNKIFHLKGKHDIYEMSKRLSNITTKLGIFDFSEIGYYGNTGLCVHNIFKDHGDHPAYRIYKILYCTVLLALLVIVSFAYIKIVMKQRSSAQVANSNAAGSTSAALTLKVALMIGFQLACWIPLITTVWYFQYITKTPASPMVFEVFALVVLPINSFLNPVFYSELYKRVTQAVNAKRKVAESLLLSMFQPAAAYNVPASSLSTAVQPQSQSEVQPSNQSTEVQPSNQSTEVQPSNQSTEVHPSNQSTEVQPSNQSTEVQPSNQSTEVQPSNQSTVVQPSNQSTEVQPSNQSTEVQPSNQSNEVQPSNESTEEQPSNQSNEVQPCYQSNEMQPINQSTEVQPSNDSTKVQPSSRSTEVQPSNESTEVQPSNQSNEVQTSNRSTEIQSSNQSTEVQPSNESTKVQPSIQYTEVQTSNRSTEIQSSNQSTEVQPSNESTKVQPSNESTEAQLSNEPTEVQTSNESTEVQPSNQCTEVQPSNQSTEVQPSNQSTEVQPSNQSTEVQPIQ